MILDSCGVVVSANKAIARMLGRSISDLVDHDFSDWVDTAYRGYVKPQFAASRNDTLACDLALCHADDRSVPARMVLRPFSTADGGVNGWWATFTQTWKDSQSEDSAYISCGLARPADEALFLQDEERKRIARDLHDGLGQSLSAIKFGIEDTLLQLKPDGNERVRQILHALVTQTKEALEEVRRVALNLRPARVDELGTVAALTCFLREFETLHRSIRVEEDLRITESDVPPPLKVTLFRIVQEAMSNVAKHACATHVRVSARTDNDFLRLSIVDNGVGFDPVELGTRPTNFRTHGHEGMRDRIRSSGGALAVTTSPGNGVALHIAWPSTQVGVRAS